MYRIDIVNAEFQQHQLISTSSTFFLTKIWHLRFETNQLSFKRIFPGCLTFSGRKLCLQSLDHVSDVVAKARIFNGSFKLMVTGIGVVNCFLRNAEEYLSRCNYTSVIKMQSRIFTGSVLVTFLFALLG